MSRKQLLALFVCSLASWTLGNGLFPLLPVYATELGAESAQVGFYLALAFVALTAGTLSAGWLSDRLRRRKALLIATGLVNVPAYWLMSRVSTAEQLAALVPVSWFLGGMTLALINALAGLFAESTQRGRVFGLLGVTTGLGAVIGGLAAGLIADRWGFPTLFVALAAAASLVPLTASLLDDKPAARRAKAAVGAWRAMPGAGFYPLLAAGVAAGAALYVGRLGTSLTMHQLGFVSAAISSTTAVGGLVALPLPLLLGWLSDRLGRKWLLTGSYLAGVVGLWLLSGSESPWQFWSVASLLSVMSFATSSVGSALVTDLVPRESLGSGLSAFNATGWVGGTIGFAVTGYAIQNFGLALTCAAGAIALLMAIAALASARRTARETESTKVATAGCAT